MMEPIRPAQKHRGISLLILERGMAGFERGRNLEKLGLHSQDTAELFFANLRVAGRIVRINQVVRGDAADGPPAGPRIREFQRVRRMNLQAARMPSLPA